MLQGCVSMRQVPSHEVDVQALSYLTVDVIRLRTFVTVMQRRSHISPFCLQVKFTFQGTRGSPSKILTPHQAQTMRDENH